MKNLLILFVSMSLLACSLNNRKLEGNIFDRDFVGDIIEIDRFECLPFLDGGQARIHWTLTSQARRNLKNIETRIVTVFMRSVENDGEVQRIYLGDEWIQGKVAAFDPGLSTFTPETLSEEYYTRVQFPDLTETKTIQVIILVRDEPGAVSSGEDERVYQTFEVGCEL